VRKLFLTLATFLVAVAPNLQANDLNSSQVPVVYINVPFGGIAKTVPSYGLQLARVQKDRTNGVNLFRSTPYADLKFNGTELDSFKLNGMNVLQKVTTYNAKGKPLTDNQRNWIMGLVIATAIAIPIAIYDDDDDDDDDDPFGQI